MAGVGVAVLDGAGRVLCLHLHNPGLSWQAPLANWQFRAAIQELKAYVQARFDAVGAAAAGAAGGASLAAARGTCRVLYRPIHLWTCAVVAPCHANPFELKARLDALVAVAATLAGAPKSNPTSTQLLRSPLALGLLLRGVCESGSRRLVLDIAAIAAATSQQGDIAKVAKALGVADLQSALLQCGWFLEARGLGDAGPTLGSAILKGLGLGKAALPTAGSAAGGGGDGATGGPFTRPSLGRAAAVAHAGFAVPAGALQPASHARAQERERERAPGTRSEVREGSGIATVDSAAQLRGRGDWERSDRASDAGRRGRGVRFDDRGSSRPSSTKRSDDEPSPVSSAGLAPSHAPQALSPSPLGRVGPGQSSADRQNSGRSLHSVDPFASDGSDVAPSPPRSPASAAPGLTNTKRPPATTNANSATGAALDRSGGSDDVFSILDEALGRATQPKSPVSAASKDAPSVHQSAAHQSGDWGGWLNGVDSTGGMGSENGGAAGADAQSGWNKDGPGWAGFDAGGFDDGADPFAPGKSQGAGGGGKAAGAGAAAGVASSWESFLRDERGPQDSNGDGKGSSLSGPSQVAPAGPWAWSPPIEPAPTPAPASKPPPAPAPAPSPTMAVPCRPVGLGAGEVRLHLAESWGARFMGRKLVQQGVTGEVLLRRGPRVPPGIMPQFTLAGVPALSSSGRLFDARCHPRAVSAGFSPGAFYVNLMALDGPSDSGDSNKGHGLARDGPTDPLAPRSALCDAGVGGASMLRYGASVRGMPPPAALSLSVALVDVAAQGDAVRATVAACVRIGVPPTARAGAANVAVTLALPHCERLLRCSPRGVAVAPSGSGPGQAVAVRWVVPGVIPPGMAAVLAVRAVTRLMRVEEVEGCVRGCRAYAEGSLAGEGSWTGAYLTRVVVGGEGTTRDVAGSAFFELYAE